MATRWETSIFLPYQLILTKIATLKYVDWDVVDYFLGSLRKKTVNFMTSCNKVGGQTQNMISFQNKIMTRG